MCAEVHFSWAVIYAPAPPPLNEFIDLIWPGASLLIFFNFHPSMDKQLPLS